MFTVVLRGFKSCCIKAHTPQVEEKSLDLAEPVTVESENSMALSPSLFLNSIY